MRLYVFYQFCFAYNFGTDSIRGYSNPLFALYTIKNFKYLF